MALRTTAEGTAALRGSTEPTGHLTLLPPPVIDIWQSEEADIEAIAFMDEAVATAGDIVDAEMDRDIPSARVIDLAGRLAVRAGLARAEVLRLRGGDVA